MELKAPRGTSDVLPEAVKRWQALEGVLKGVFGRYGYAEIRTPMFEDIHLFKRGVGDTTDIVEKEMFTLGRGEEGDAYALRPELTASSVRAYLEHNQHKVAPFQKWYYYGAAFRYERPQAGRQRQFHQWGIEAIGSRSPLLDVEAICVAADIYRGCGLTEFEVRLNTLGDRECRPRYREALKQALAGVRERLCEKCKQRFERNIFRVLDCKNPNCAQLTAGAPSIEAYLNAECRDDFAAVRSSLDRAGVGYRVDHRLVRGLDYYSKTVFEFTSPLLGAQDALCGGGRYDYLISDLGGPELGAVGFAASVERLFVALDKCKSAALGDTGAALDVFVVVIPDKDRADSRAQLNREAFMLVQELRAAGLRADMDFEDRSAKAQMRSANKSGARFAYILGATELATSAVQIKDLAASEETSVPRAQSVAWVRGRKP